MLRIAAPAALPYNAGMPEPVKAALKADLAPGAAKLVTVKGVDVALFHVEGKYSAIDNTCPHRGGPLSDGSLSGRTVTCPWHAWEFDVTTGACLNNPSAKVRCYPVEAQGDDLVVMV